MRKYDIIYQRSQSIQKRNVHIQQIAWKIDRVLAKLIDETVSSIVEYFQCEPRFNYMKLKTLLLITDHLFYRFRCIPYAHRFFPTF